MSETQLDFIIWHVAVPFVVFTGIAFSVRGMKAVQWSLGTLRSVRTNIALSLINGLMMPAIFFAVAWTQGLFDALGAPHIAASFWTDVPLIVMLLVYLVVYDLVEYWNHRLLHWGGFWAVHAIHHSDPDVNHTTTFRVHIIEPLIMLLSNVVLANWLGLPPEIAVMTALFKLMYNKFVHLNVDMHFGPLTKVLATPRFHRWHHADTPDAYNTNFASIFSFWDVMFGTYRVPGRCDQKLGFEGSPGHNFFLIMVWPFLEWAKMLGWKQKEPELA